MDINVAIVEDEDAIARELRRALLSWAQSKIKEYDFLIKHFSSGKSFLEASEQFDLVFLDIELESKESGLKVAQTMRMNGLQTPIVFLTAHKDKMFFGYKVRALDFLVKPIKQPDINWCLDQQQMEKCRKRKPSSKSKRTCLKNLFNAIDLIL